jgi:cyclohexa-1,5-dienecarbonyl-CoA hydratase
VPLAGLQARGGKLGLPELPERRAQPAPHDRPPALLVVDVPAVVDDPEDRRVRTAPERVLAVNVTLPTARYATPQQRLQFFQSLDERVRALPGVFSAGVDVAAHAPERVDAMLDTFHRLLRRLDGLPQATVAAIDGPCLGGACELASLCDIVLAAPRATFGQPEIDLGCFPPVGAVTLPRLMGKAASAMVLGGESLSAAEAARLGLVTAVVDDLAGETDRWVTRLSAKSGTALAGARRALRAGACGSLGDALERTERLYRDEIARSPDAAEGVAAFLAKRPPRWERG